MRMGHNNVAGRPVGSDAAEVCARRPGGDRRRDLCEIVRERAAKAEEIRVSRMEADRAAATCEFVPRHEVSKVKKYYPAGGSDRSKVMRRLINDDLLSPCGKWTVGKYYEIEADLPGDKVLVEDDRGIKMIVLGYGFKEV